MVTAHSIMHTIVLIIKSFFRKIFGKPYLTAARVLSLLLLLSITLLFYISIAHVNIKIIEGEPSPATIVSEIDFLWVDEDQSDKIITDRINSAPAIFVLDPDIENQQIRKIDSDLDSVIGAFQKKDENPYQKIVKIWGIPEQFSIYSFDQTKMIALKSICKEILASLYERGIFRTDNPVSAITNYEIRRKSDNILVDKQKTILFKDSGKFLESYIRKTIDADEQYIAMALYITNNYISENIWYDAEITMRNRDSIRQNFIPEKMLISKGELLCSKGQVVVKKNVLMVNAMYASLKRMAFIRIVGLIFFLAIVWVITKRYLISFHQAEFKSAQMMIILTGLFFIILVGLFSRLFPLEYTYMFPYIAFPIMSYYVFRTKFTLISGLIFSLVFMMFYTDPRFAFLHALTTIFFLIHAVRLRTRIPSVKIFLITYVFSLATSLVVDTAFIGKVPSLPIISIRCMISVFFGFIVGYGFLFIYEKLSDITSEIRLKELLDMNQPLLKELMNHAPGTYRHSIIVAELSEEACKHINADPLLAKVGGLYHDVGKIRRPDYYIENQMLGQNKHDALPPLMSVRILKNHVADADAKLRQYGFGKRIRDIVREHHGKSLIKFFYTKALKNTRKEDIIEQYFRYDGPIPSSKEAAVVFLADKAEAVSRVMVNASIVSLAERINKLITEALEDGQLDNAPLTLAELKIVENSFMRYFRGLLHKRIEYPDIGKE